jgi:antirestriction protein ArdC
MKLQSSKPRPQRDYYQEVTDQIIEALEKGIVPWRRTWNQAACGIPMNPTTGRVYRGINHLLLGLSQAIRFNDDPRWCSYRQAQARGWQVRAGEHGTIVVFYKRILKEPKAHDDGAAPYFQMLRFSTIFHLSQMDGAPEYVRPSLDDVPWRTPEAIEVIMTNSGADIRFGGGQAFFSPLTDHIQMPPRQSFESAEAFAQTMIHESGHWACAKPRLDLSESGRFGSAAYAGEELRVEISSAMVCAALGVVPDISNVAAYLSSWLRKFKDDKREIFRAAADAQRIADFLLAFHPGYAASLSSGDGDDTVSESSDDTTLSAAA